MGALYIRAAPEHSTTVARSPCPTLRAPASTQRGIRHAKSRHHSRVPQRFGLPEAGNYYPMSTRENTWRKRLLSLIATICFGAVILTIMWFVDAVLGFEVSSSAGGLIVVVIFVALFMVPAAVMLLFFAGGDLLIRTWGAIRRGYFAPRSDADRSRLSRDLIRHGFTIDTDHTAARWKIVGRGYELALRIDRAKFIGATASIAVGGDSRWNVKVPTDHDSVLMEQTEGPEPPNWLFDEFDDCGFEFDTCSIDGVSVQARLTGPDTDSIIAFDTWAAHVLPQLMRWHEDVVQEVVALPPP